ncbi:uncharacterized protein DUF4956 [Pseudonocardia hierapolitana]|uniref:Uncharacterized protein DUF4956 n=1 Tax=Pseudonocardia hierapolitana TaxID=1128676 RepID=A0A561SUC2_9PSEU|nr:DUF4956 domain-containing protein [Pseudonocardia hierapolitana]TWF78459.1 uncharacterized protein DUF4956 [Pseudonocardia hierapolitana]
MPGTPVSLYIEYGIDLGIDLLAIFLLAYVLYYRRHRRADLLLAYVTLNIGIFVAMSLLSTVRVDLALGFGLFAILSIIRLRSSTVTQQEVAYYFVALVAGLVNGLSLDDRVLAVGINVLLVATMLVVDSRPLRARAQRLEVTLDVVHHDDDALIADLERRLGGRVMHHVVDQIDYVRDVMIVDVRFQAATRAPDPSVNQQVANAQQALLNQQPAINQKPAINQQGPINQQPAIHPRPSVGRRAAVRPQPGNGQQPGNGRQIANSGQPADNSRTVIVDRR